MPSIILVNKRLEIIKNLKSQIDKRVLDDLDKNDVGVKLAKIIQSDLDNFIRLYEGAAKRIEKGKTIQLETLDKECRTSLKKIISKSSNAEGLIEEIGEIIEKNMSKLEEIFAEPLESPALEQLDLKYSKDAVGLATDGLPDEEPAVVAPGQPATPARRRQSEPAPQSSKSGVSAMLPGFNKALQGTVVAATMVPQVPSVDSPKSAAGEEQRHSIFQILRNNHDTQRWKWQIVNKDDENHCKATLSDKTTIEINRGEITCAGTAEGDKAFVAAAAALNPGGKIIIQYRNDPSEKKLEALAKLCKKAGLEPILAHSPDQYKTLKKQYETEAAEQLKNKPKSPGQS